MDLPQPEVSGLSISKSSAGLGFCLAVSGFGGDGSGVLF